MAGGGRHIEARQPVGLGLGARALSGYGWLGPAACHLHAGLPSGIMWQNETTSRGVSGDDLDAQQTQVTGVFELVARWLELIKYPGDFTAARCQKVWWLVTAVLMGTRRIV